MRTPFVAGNWKMFTTAQTAGQLAEAVAAGTNGLDRVLVALCPPFPYLARVRQAIEGSRVELGAQNLYPEKEGAFTGEVSPTMLLDVGCRWVILGHSERRHKLGESDAFINRKVRVARAAGLGAILCLGETLEEREAGETRAVLDRQLSGSLKDVAPAVWSGIVLAYEPVWAIGTGRNATPEQAEDAHAFIRRRVAETHGPAVAENVRIQYGGSVKPDNAATLMDQPDVDGALVGGASLQADTFLAIVRAAVPVRHGSG